VNDGSNPSRLEVGAPSLSYRERLRELINDPHFGVLLHADRWWRERRSRQENGSPRAAFKLGSSERFQKEFITLWELFDHATEFQECLNQLAQEVRWIRGKYPFSTIVTSTATSRHILERLHPLIETPEDKIRLEFLHRYPFLARDRQSVLSFQGQKVLIFTDVVASGSLVHDLATVVYHLGGEVKAVLCVVLAGKEFTEQIPLNARPIREQPPKIALRLASPPLDTDPIPILSADGTPILDGRDAPLSEVPLFSLTDRELGELGPKEYSESQTITIDLESVYPEELPQGVDGIRPRFGIAHLYEHLEQAKALLFDFFEFEGSHFTTGIRVPDLLSRFGGEIWGQIEHEFDPVVEACCDSGSAAPSAANCHEPHRSTDLSEPARPRFALVSTFRAGDAEFRSCVEQSLRGAIRQAAARTNSAADFSPLTSIYVNVRELPEGTDYMLFPQGSDDELRGRHVYLLLASVGASQTLQDLVALLAASAVNSITVVVLINRMGLRTQNFVARIRKLVRGLSPRGSDDASFDFVPVYSLTELGSRDVRALEDAIRTLFRTYRERTQVPGFRNWIEQTRRYFEPRVVTGIEFRSDGLRQLPTPVTLKCHDFQSRCDGELTTLTVTTLEAQLSCLCQRMVVDRNYDGLIALTAHLENKRDLYQVFALLLHGVGFLRRRNKFRQLRETFLSRIAKLREERFAAEREHLFGPCPLYELIERNVELEAHLLFGLALFSYLDIQHHDYDDILLDALGVDRDQEECLATPLNSLTTFGNERWAWSFSMLLLLSRQQFGDDATWIRLRGRLVRSIRGYKDHLGEWKKSLTNRLADYSTAEEDGSVRSLETLSRLCRDNLDSLLTDLGQHRLVRYDQIVRFLHRHLFQKPHHSPIISTFKKLRLELDAELKAQAVSRTNDSRRIRLSAATVKRALEEASSTIGLLEQVANASADMFGFTPAERDHVARFAELYGEDSFLADVQRLGTLLRSIRNDNSLSVAEFRSIGSTITRFQEDLFGERSPLRDSLRRYLVPLREAVIEAMQYARDRFARTLRKKREGKKVFKRYRHVFDRELERWKQLGEGDCPLVLVDPFLLRETLRNVCTNVRHTVEGLKLKSGRYPDLLDVSWEAFERLIDDDPTMLVRLSIRCRGREPRETSSFSARGTFHEQMLALEKYGAKLVLRPLPSPERGTLTEIELIRRMQAPTPNR
jgi:hypoxanthine-guanine phosphoribosyltransferase